jgi:hypothetical protein
VIFTESWRTQEYLFRLLDGATGKQDRLLEQMER